MGMPPITSPLRRLADLGQRVWLIDPSREFLDAGQLEQLIRHDGVRGLTSTPTSFAHAVFRDESYVAELLRLPPNCAHPRDLLLKLAVRDAQRACDMLRSCWDGGDGRSGWVSIDVDPHMADNARSIVRAARRLVSSIRRPNLFVGIPATDSGVMAVSDCVALGMSVNVSAVCSASRHRQVARAYLHGLTRLIRTGGNPRRIASVVSFPVSRIDDEVDARLARLSRSEDLGRAGVATAKLAYQTFERVFASADWERLEAHGAHPQWCVWLSDAQPSAAHERRHMQSLVGPHTIAAIPHGSIQALRRPAPLDPHPVANPAGAGAVIRRLHSVGVDMDEVAAVLERKIVLDEQTALCKVEQHVEQRLRGDRVSSPPPSRPIQDAPRRPKVERASSPPPSRPIQDAPRRPKVDRHVIASSNGVPVAWARAGQ